MNWIVLYEKAGNIILTSKRGENTGLLPKGSYITIDMTIGVDDDEKREELADQRFVLRVEESEQTAVYSPSPLLADMDLSVRALNCLKAAEVETLGELVSYSKSDLMKFRNFGKKSLTELEELVHAKGLNFGFDVAKYKLDADK